ncbi:MAG: hypothetical protein IPK52_27360 [Chloroflexi bacterium]|nr:hypothetical protein [Chloroflexota bacterium]
MPADNQLVFLIVARVSDVPANVGPPAPDIDAVNVATLTYETPDDTGHHHD